MERETINCGRREGLQVMMIGWMEIALNERETMQGEEVKLLNDQFVIEGGKCNGRTV